MSIIASLIPIYVLYASFIFVSSEDALLLQEVAYIHPFENNNMFGLSETNIFYWEWTFVRRLLWYEGSPTLLSSAPLITGHTIKHHSRQILPLTPFIKKSSISLSDSVILLSIWRATVTTAGVGGALVVIESDTIVKSWSHFTRDYQMSPSIVEDLVP